MSPYVMVSFYIGILLLNFIHTNIMFLSTKKLLFYFYLFQFTYYFGIYTDLKNVNSFLLGFFLSINNVHFYKFSVGFYFSYYFLICFKCNMNLKFVSEKMFCCCCNWFFKFIFIHIDYCIFSESNYLFQYWCIVYNK